MDRTNEGGLTVVRAMHRYGLLGRALSHSFSRDHFTRKFEREGLVDHRYELYELDRIEDLPALLAATPDLRGLNVTIPYKQAVLPYLHALDPLTAAAGAVNTIAIQEGRLTGYNTDVEGFRTSLLELVGDARPRALVLGSGGASRAVVYVLKELGIRFRVVSRSMERGEITWDLLDPIIVKACPLIINTTPLGMHPEVSAAPALPYEAIGPRHCLLDLIYNPAETVFLRRGREQGARTMNGMPMLLAQAEAAWRIWNAAN